MNTTNRNVFGAEALKSLPCCYHHTSTAWRLQTTQDGQIDSRDGGSSVAVTTTDEKGEYVLLRVSLCMGAASEANARLASAAPRLLIALHNALGALADAQRLHPHWIYTDVQRQGMEALSEVTGGRKDGRDK